MSVQSKKVWAPGPWRAAPTTQTGDALSVDRLTRAMDVGGEPLPIELTDGCDWGLVRRAAEGHGAAGKRSRNLAAMRAAVRIVEA